MTITQQALHIFRKDVRRLRWEVAAVLCIAALLVWLWTDSWSGETNDDVIRLRSREIAGPYLAAIWFLMIARLLHAEPVVGDRHFWLTRPYSRSALLLAKGLFAACFLLLPLLIAQILAVVMSGLKPSLGALLVNQLAIAAVVCLPAAAVASITRNLWQYVPLAAVGGIAAASAWLVTLGTTGGPVRHIVGIILLGGLSAGLLLAQYHTRRTLRNAAVYLAACTGVWTLVVEFPSELSWAAQSALDGADEHALTFGIAPSSALDDLEPLPSSYPQRLSPPGMIRLPIEVAGADVRNLVPADPFVTLRTADGASFRVDASIWQDSSSLSLVFSRYASNLPWMRSNRPTSEPLSLHAEFWVKQFVDVATAELPADGSAVMLDDRMQCRAIRRPSSTSGTWRLETPAILMCRHALSAAPWREIEAGPLPRPIHAPFRSIFLSRVVVPTIDPIREVRAQLPRLTAGEVLTGATSTTVALRERAAFYRATLDADNLRLADYVVP